MEKLGSLLPPLGLAYIAAVLEKNGDEIKIIDGLVLSSKKGYGFKELENDIKEFKPNLVGVTATSPQISDAIKTINIVKKVCPNCVTFLGGPHITALPSILKDIKSLDYGIYGEGEITFLNVAKKFKNNQKLGGIDGIIWRNHKKEIKFKKPKFITNLDDLPFPAWHLLPIKLYRPSPPNYRRLPAITMMTSRGCPHNCIFCHKPIFGKYFRSHSAERVIAEIECLQNNYGIKDIQFFDDTFTLNRERVVDICNIIINKNVDISWNCMTRIDAVDEELLRLMKEAGCYEVGYGTESGSERILKLINKGISKNQIRKSVKFTKRIGIDIRAFFMIGFPTETKEEIMQTIDFAKELNPDVAQFMMVTPYPDTKLWDLCEQDNKFDVGDWSNFTLYAPQGAPFVPSTMSSDELNELYIKAIKSYHLRPKFVWEHLKKIRNFNDLKRKFVATKAIIGLWTKMRKEVWKKEDKKRLKRIIKESLEEVGVVAESVKKNEWPNFFNYFWGSIIVNYNLYFINKQNF